MPQIEQLKYNVSVALNKYYNVNVFYVFMMYVIYVQYKMLNALPARALSSR